MANKLCVWAVVPAFNEATVIGETIRGLRGRVPNVVVIDDCSEDDTASAAVRAGAHVCRHPFNLGQGAALQTGIDYAIGQGAECIVTFDADGQHDPDDVDRMIEAMLSQDVDVVLASRFLGQTEGMSWRKRIFLKLAVLFTRSTTRLRVTDTHNGLRVLSRKAATQIRIHENRMAHASEILEQIAELGLTHIETPCTITYTDYSVQKGQRMTGAFAILADLAIRRLQR